MEQPPRPDMKHRIVKMPLLESLVTVKDPENPNPPLTAEQIFMAMKGRLRNNRFQKQVLTIIGGTRAGKTTLLGEMAEHLDKGGFANQGAVITFDSALQVAKKLGLVEKKHHSGQYTPEEYHRTSQLMEKAISLALRDERIQYVLVETVGITGMDVDNEKGQSVRLGMDRGASTLKHIARTSGDLEDISYDDCYIHMAADGARQRKGLLQRVDIARHPQQPAGIFEAHGVTFYGSKSDTPFGGSVLGTVKVDAEVSDTLTKLYRLNLLPFSMKTMRDNRIYFPMY